MITVIGLGFVGLTTALGLAEFGNKVYGIDANRERSEMILGGTVPFHEPGLKEALDRHLGKNFLVTEDLQAAAADSEVVLLCVGTPFGEEGKADLSQLTGAMREIVSAVHDDRKRIMTVKSSVPPGTSDKVLLPYLTEIDTKKQWHLAANPEFLREGKCWDDFVHADRIVLGVRDAESDKALRYIYRNAPCEIISTSVSTAEFIKYLSNTALACLISYANEMSITADHIGGIDVEEAFHVLLKDKRWKTGSISAYMYPGRGYGGYCLPKDTEALYQTAKENGYSPSILGDVIAVNNGMAGVMAERIIARTKSKEDCIGILGLSFNAGSDDVRCSQSAPVIRELKKRGYENLLAYDPLAMDAFNKHYPDCGIRYAERYDELLKKADVIALLTVWDEFRGIRQQTEKPVVGYFK